MYLLRFALASFLTIFMLSSLVSAGLTYMAQWSNWWMYLAGAGLFFVSSIVVFPRNLKRE